MINIKVTINGVSPLICNKFTDKAALAATTGVSSNNRGELLTPQETAEEKLYMHKKKACIPQPNLLASIIEGGRFHKIKNRSVTTMQKSMIPSCFDIKGTMLPIKTKDGWEVDERPVRIPATGGRILAYRPKFNDWQLQFDATLDTDIISVNLMREILDDAGKRIGLGDYRPDRKGPFGKYKVNQWQVKKRS
jgi:hypothetical protein